MELLKRQEAKDTFIKCIDCGCIYTDNEITDNMQTMTLHIYVPEEDDPIYKENPLGVKTPRELLLKMYQAYWSVGINYITADLLKKFDPNIDEQGMSDDEFKTAANIILDQSRGIFQIKVVRDRNRPSNYDKSAEYTRKWAFEMVTGVYFTTGLINLMNLVKGE